MDKHQQLRQQMHDRKVIGSAAQVQQFNVMTRDAYLKLEAQFPMQHTKDPVEAGIQVGQQMVLQALRNGFTVG